MPSRFLCPRATAWSPPAACNIPCHNLHLPSACPTREMFCLPMKKAQPFGWTFLFGAGDEATPPRAPGTPMVALPSSRQCPTVHRTVGFNCSSLVTRKKAQPFGWTFYGAGDEARTRYLHLGKVALYRMSYTRIGKPAADRRNRISSIPTDRERVVPPVGIEPTTRGFSVRCSTY